MSPEPKLFSLQELPSKPEVLIESPRWSMVKRRVDGSVDFVSPLPCPYNYGCIPHLLSDDGDPLDAVVLGPRLSRGQRLLVRTVGVVDFLDAGRGDPKVICCDGPFGPRDRAGLELFFSTYAHFKRALHRTRGQLADTRFRGWLLEPAGEARGE
ncbi:inorganic diphosphatase [Stigmatella aurantiaca]|uniref:inorganic diphosphatase n=2 Tax=Stigmatella aurantiaca (strain DW4/3-1) TaxID=378806 RepID=E3FCB1_STIAD|nr:inorganic diphosphatase [Stigmatella aurantiaca]ADO70034.1 Inorganic pyrophosphatase [Stigmatella aurantiaca DW4/3-1]